MSDTIAATDDQALELRRAGRSYPAIAKTLGYAHARDALEAFRRALQRRDPDEQRQLRYQELQRLDALAEHLEARTDLTPEELATKLHAVDRLREIVAR
jgi:hypothetical protein